MDNSVPLTDKYYDEEYRKNIYRCQLEWLMTMHMEVWEHYGKKIFLTI
jgi:hypothetical protein